MIKTLNSSKWVFFNSITQQLIGFLFFGSMTYLLSPKLFGVYAIGLIFSEVIGQIVRLGMSANLINRKKYKSLALNNAFWITLIFGVFFSVSFYLLAYLVVLYFDISEHILVIQVMSILPFIFALGCVPDALLQRKFLYKKIAFATFIASIISCVVAGIIAFTQFSQFTFVIQKVTYEMIMLVIIWKSIKWRPRWLIDYAILIEQLRVSVPLLFAGLTNVAANKLKDIFIASALGPSSLGIYRLAIKLQDFLVKITIGPITAVAIPSLARVKEDDFKETIGTFINWMGILSFPIFTGVAVMSPELLNVLFTDEWAEAAAILQMLCLLGVLSVYIHMFKPIFSVLEQGFILVKLRMIYFVLLFILLFFTASYGILYIIFSEIIVTILLTFLGLFSLKKVLQFNAFYFLRDLKPALASSLFMLFVMLFTKTLLNENLIVGDFFLLLIFFFLGIISYFIFLKLFFAGIYAVINNYIKCSKLYILAIRKVKPSKR
ncbi:oligosaccharide flippase family protein [Pseudoalteromonas sp. NZS11]|uniref:oligosaccharide flippase family protein n=1 Tax=Pseudoalteromonas sp. NZS11 TaxID=2792049 RepID=UPI0018CCBD9A|nr:oligosaccharide flippase family protein [Pseudoalteromonas sp. NZS11]MBH0080947.1 oligosaccharide flippase family protein [Pseudoalteromonas sp. NZS11]